MSCLVDQVKKQIVFRANYTISDVVQKEIPHIGLLVLTVKRMSPSANPNPKQGVRREGRPFNPQSRQLDKLKTVNHLTALF